MLPALLGWDAPWMHGFVKAAITEPWIRPRRSA